MIFTLSPILGGRTEVLNTPFTEALQHLLYYREREEHKKEAEEGRIWLDFLSRMNSHPFAPEQQRKAFMNKIEPKNQKNQNTGAANTPPSPEQKSKRFETNDALMKHLKARTDALIQEKQQLKKGG